MSKTIEFVEKEIENSKEFLDEAIHYNLTIGIKNETKKLETLQQIKCVLEAWEELNKTFEIGVDEQIEEIYIKGKNYYGNEITIWSYSKDGGLKVKKALELKNV